MQKRSAKTVILLLCISFLSMSASGEAPQRRLLLVTGENSKIPSLTHLEVKKIFLGVPEIKGGVRLKPIRNASDDLITEVFLQKIIFMSKRRYEHEIVTRVFRDGGVRPPVYKDISELVDELRQSPEALTYMWASQLEQSSGVKSVGVLWEGLVY